MIKLVPLFLSLMVTGCALPTPEFLPTASYDSISHYQHKLEGKLVNFAGYNMTHHVTDDGVIYMTYKEDGTFNKSFSNASEIVEVVQHYACQSAQDAVSDGLVVVSLVNVGTDEVYNFNRDVCRALGYSTPELSVDELF